jgi:ribosomal protein L11 methyltransferase
MISVYLDCDPAEADELLAELYERGTVGVQELVSGLRAWFEDGVDLRDLIERYRGEVVREEEEDWVRRTEDSFPPIAIGERLWLAPPWNHESPPPGRLRLEINPGLACGTGWHECTQLCLEAIEQYLRPGGSLLDVGVGSGILSAAAQLLGADRVIGCDIDRDSAAIARERIGNRVFVGTAHAARSHQFDVVVANISGPAVEALLPELLRVCRAGGVLILSGFQVRPDMEDPLEIRERGGWLAMVVRTQ